MAKHPLWSDEYWLLLMQLYLKKPVGVKPLYSRGIVDLSLDLHIPPEFLHAQMFKLRMITPRIGRLWEKYGKSPKKLARGVELLRRMKGYGILILDLYFQLTPITMVPETPEVNDLAKLIKVSPKLIAEVMEVYQFCDPYLNRADFLLSPLLVPCQEVWNRFGNDNPEKLYQLASQLKEYWK